MKNKLLLIILFGFISQTVYSQKQGQLLIDSLKAELPKSSVDSIKINLFNAIGEAYINANPDSSNKYTNLALHLAEKIVFKKGIASAYNNLTFLSINSGNDEKSKQYGTQAIKMAIESGDQQTLFGAYSNCGSSNLYHANYPEALNNFYKALKIAEGMDKKDRLSKQNLANAYLGIALIYDGQNKAEEALKNYFISLTLAKEIDNWWLLAADYNDIANIYNTQLRYAEALKFYSEALHINQKSGNKMWEAYNYDNIGVVNAALKNYAEALEGHFTSLKILHSIGDKAGLADNYNNIGNIYIKLKKFADARIYLDSALQLSTKIGYVEYIKFSYQKLCELDSATGNWKSAYENHKQFIFYRDSMVNEVNTKKIVQTAMQYDFDKKESQTKAEQEKKDAVAQKEVQKQKLVRNGFIGGFAVVLLFAGVFFRQRNKISKAKKISEAEKERSEELLLNILPAEVAEEIKTTGTAKAKAFTMVTVMFTDFKDFTIVSERVSAELLVDEIHTCFSAFDNILQKHKIEKIKTIGDAYLCASGLPVSNYTHAVDMLNAAFEIRNYILQRKKEKEARGEIPFELRIGIHTGAVVAGIVGVKKYAYDIWGDTVNLAARMEQNSEAGKINISASTYELIKDKFNCTHRGKIQTKNKGEIDMYFVETVS